MVLGKYGGGGEESIESTLLLKVCERKQKLRGVVDSGALESDLDLNSGSATSV